MFIKTYGSTVYGVEARLISIEVNIVQGTKLFIVGLPDNAIKESAHRIESVLKQLGKRMPRRRVIVNLAPASLRKEGAYYDLPIALAILHASSQVNLPALSEYLIMGELALDGTLRPIRGTLPIALDAIKHQFKGFLLPKDNAIEAAIVDKLNVFPISHIQEAIAFLQQQHMIQPLKIDAQILLAKEAYHTTLDFADVKGQQQIKRSIEVAAAGGHNLLMVGPPGAGKTMLAKRMGSILPPLTLAEALESSKIYSITGKLDPTKALITQRPFCAPHHTISDVALVGGGSLPQPGQISLAHHGVLFLDELPEFKRTTLEALRQPMEDKKIHITRARFQVTFPANFMLVVSMNPCPCGYYTHPQKACSCTPLLRKRYMSRISGPLFDRIDLQVEVTPVPFSVITTTTPHQNSHTMRQRVASARERQKVRFHAHPTIRHNGMIPPKFIPKWCPLPPTAQQLLHEVIDRLQLSSRAYTSICKMARTIADLEEKDLIKDEHVAEAIWYRNLDRSQWGE